MRPLVRESPPALARLQARTELLIPGDEAGLDQAVDRAIRTLELPVVPRNRRSLWSLCTTTGRSACASHSSINPTESELVARVPGIGEAVVDALDGQVIHAHAGGLDACASRAARCACSNLEPSAEASADALNSHEARPRTLAMLLEINPTNPEPRKIRRAVDALEAGEIIAYPTDTVYGLGCDLFNKKAIDRLYSIKGMLRSQNLAFVCRDLGDVARYAVMHDHVYRVLKQYLPGPYCFILEVDARGAESDSVPAQDGRRSHPQSSRSRSR